MNKTITALSVKQFAEFINNNEVAWQMCDSLIEFTRIGENQLTEDSYKEMLDTLANAKECSVFNPDTCDKTGFEDLIQWSQEEDLLVIVDDVLLFCIAQCDKDKVMAMVA